VAREQAGEADMRLVAVRWRRKKSTGTDSNRKIRRREEEARRATLE
jgi:hypothetical protein